MSSHLLGISAFYHDSAAVLLKDGKILAAAQEERFSRIKHDPSFPRQAVAYVLTAGNIAPADLTALAFYDKPLLKFERLLETYHSFAPAGLDSFLQAIPIWTKEKLFLRRIIHKELAALAPAGQISPQSLPILFPEHHLSHAASAFFPSPFAESAILTIDGVGEWATTTIGHGKDNTITLLQELHFPHSLGLLYSAATAYCGFRVNSGEYKLMGLAPYGNAAGSRFKQYKNSILDNLVDIRDDGSLLLNMEYFDFPTGLAMCNDHLWEKLFQLAKRDPEQELISPYLDLALAFQQVTEEVVLKLTGTARKITGSTNLVLAGGVALNCVANGKLLRSKLFKNIWIQPAAGDAGGALGAALAGYHIWASSSRPPPPQTNDAMQGCLLGPEYTNEEIKKILTTAGIDAKNYCHFDALCTDTATLLGNGKIIGWFQGRMEFGPRALGNRSILADPRNLEMIHRINMKIKFREGFRPLAPAVLEEDAGQYFDLDCQSPYMLLVSQVAKEKRIPVSQNTEDLDIPQQLAIKRSEITAVTHVDYSARIQTVSCETNPKFHTLITAFKKLTGCAVLLNTSFNVRGEPIVCTPEDALNCFKTTEMDYLILGNYLIKKQPADGS